MPDTVLGLPTHIKDCLCPHGAHDLIIITSQRLAHSNCSINNAAVVAAPIHKTFTHTIHSHQLIQAVTKPKTCQEVISASRLNSLFNGSPTNILLTYENLKQSFKKCQKVALFKGKANKHTQPHFQKHGTLKESQLLNAMWDAGLDPGTEKGHQWRSRISPNKVWILVNPPSQSCEMHQGFVKC